MRPPANSAVCARLSVKVQPKASRDALDIQPDGSVRLAITAPPVDGEANKAVCAFLAKKLAIAKSSITVVSGERSRNKLISIAGMNLDQVMALLRR